MIPVTYGCARVSKTDDATRNLETQLHVPQDFEVWEDHIFEGAMLGSSISRFAWSDLIARTRPNYTVTVDVAWLDRFNRNFDEDVRIQAEITKQNIGVAAIRGGINTADDSAAAKLFRRMSWPRGPTRWSPPASDKSGPGPNQGRKEKARTPAGSHTRAGRGMLADVRGDTFDPPSGPHHEGLAGYREAALMLDAVHSVHSMA